MDYYTSHNDYPVFALLGANGWGWVLKQSAYNVTTNETEAQIELGYEGDTVMDYQFFSGDVDALACMFSIPEYAGSTGPVRGGGFPPPPSK